MALGLVFALLTIVIGARFWPHHVAPLRTESPLDVDKGLPLPEAGQGSSICSLTALFGPYLVLFLLFGLPALLGLVTGSILGLVLIWKHLSTEDRDSGFQGIIEEKLRARPGTGVVLLLIVLIQIGFATSELLVLQDLISHALDLSARKSGLFTAAVAIIGYLYMISGGYAAVFRTDVIQYAFVVLMCITIVVVNIELGWSFDERIAGGVEPALWVRAGWSPITAACNGSVCFLMALAFVLASPDTWKRVHVVSRKRGNWRFIGLVAAGMLPFLLVLPAAFAAGKISRYDTPPLRLMMAEVSGAGAFAETAILLGLICSFLSSFDSALLGAVHMQVVRVNSRRPGFDSLKNFYFMIGVFFLLANAVFATLPATPVQNAYAVANVLLGPFCIASGFLLGSRGLKHMPRTSDSALIAAVAFFAWALVLVGNTEIFHRPCLEQVRTIPFGIGIFVVVAAATAALAGRRQS